MRKRGIFEDSMSKAPLIPSPYWLAATLLLILTSMSAIAQQRLSLPSDVVIKAGQTMVVDVTGDLDVPVGSLVSIDFAFTPSVITAVSGNGAPTFALQCATVPVSRLTIIDAANGSFTLACDNSNAIIGGTVCQLELLGLAGVRTSGEVRITRVSVNGSPLSIDPLPAMTVIVTGNEDVGPQNAEGLRRNFPNPFAGWTTIEYSVAYPGVVAFDVRDLTGREYQVIGGQHHDVGNYSLQLLPQTWTMSSGHYLVRMITETGIHTLPIAVQK